MRANIKLADIDIEITFKAIKNVHLSVHPPDGRVTLAAPTGTRLEVVRAYAISKLSWLRDQREKLLNLPRESRREYLGRESHYLWGRRYLLSVEYRQEKPSVRFDHKKVTLTVRPGTSRDKREQVLQEWHRSLLHSVLPAMIETWEAKLDVTVEKYFLQQMKTRWGSCNHKAGHIRLNTELVKKPKDLLEYVLVHEMLHLIEPKHNDDFVRLLDASYPRWRLARQELNELPTHWDV